MSRTWGKRIRKWLTDYLELPSDVLMNFPRITLIGQVHLYIENHRGLAAFEEEEVRIWLDGGQLRVKGKHFVIRRIFPEELLLEGKIEYIQFLNES
jgi:sporulation protein YqfC